MIISHEHKFIFIKTRKTAGTSLEIGLSKICGPRDVLSRLGEPEENKVKFGYAGERNYRVPPVHWTKRDMLKIPLYGLPRFESHSPASFVREHVDPEIWRSYFKFCFERNPYDRIISQYFWNTRNKKIPIEQYIETAEPYRLSNWHMYTIHDRVAVDFVGQFERLNEDLEIVRTRIGLPASVELAQTKMQHRPKESGYRDLLDEQLQTRIAVICAKEIIQFGYQF